MFKVSEIAEKLSVSKTSVYKKIEKLKPSFKKYIKRVKGVIYIDTDGFEILKNHFESKTVETMVGIGSESKLTEILLLEKDKQIEQLKEQLKEKDKSLNHALQLVENSQVLLKQDQERIVMLEHKLEDNESISINQQNEKKGFIHSFFSKKI